MFYRAYGISGASDLLRAELVALGATCGEPGRAWVDFDGDAHIVANAILGLRTANAVVVPLAELDAQSGDSIYETALGVNWAEWLHVSETFSFRMSGKLGKENTHHLRLRVKDALADHFDRKFSQRPSVDLESPDVKFHLAFRDVGTGQQTASVATLSLEIGSELNKRGYRPHKANAPLRETLAASVLLRLGYDGSAPLVDPLCGSGTFGFEAAMIRDNVAPGVFSDRPYPWREVSPFRPVSKAEWREVKSTLADRVRAGEALIVCSDIDRQAVRDASKRAKAQGIKAAFRVKELTTVRPPEGAVGLLLANPPYGRRLGVGSEVIELHRALGDVARRHFLGWKLGIISATKDGLRAVGLKSDQQWPFKNGGRSKRSSFVTKYRKPHRKAEYDER